MKSFRQHLKEANRRRNTIDYTKGVSKKGMGKGAVNSPRVVSSLGSSKNINSPVSGPVGSPSGPAKSDFERLPYPQAAASARARALRGKIMNTPQTKAKPVGVPTQVAKPVTPQLKAAQSPNLNTVSASGKPPASVTKGNYVNEPFPKAAAVKNAYDVTDKGPTSTVKAKTGVGTSPPKGVEMVDPLRSTPKEILQVWKDYQRGKRDVIQKGAKTISKAAAPVLQKAREYLGTDKPVAPEKAPWATALLGKDGGPKSSVKTVTDKPTQAAEVKPSQTVQAGPPPSNGIKANPPSWVQQGMKGITTASQLAASQLARAVKSKGTPVSASGEKPTALSTSRDNSGISDTSQFWSKTAGTQQSKQGPGSTVQAHPSTTLNRANPQVGASAPRPGLTGSPSGTKGRPSTTLNRANPQVGASAPKSGLIGTPSGPANITKSSGPPLPTIKPQAPAAPAAPAAPKVAARPSSRSSATRARGVRRPSAPSKSSWGFHGTATGTASRGMSAGSITNRALGGVYEEKVPEVVKESFESFIRNTFLKENHDKK